MSAASSNALAKLEPFLLLAKSARGAAAAKLILEATAAPGCYVFSELFEFDGIKELGSSEQYQAEYRLLELFAYGDLSQYRAAPSGTFPELKPNHLSKLRHLTLVSLASQRRVLSYAILIRELDLSGSSVVGSSNGGPSSHMSARDMRALEDVIIEAIYAGIFSARLDQRRQRVEVESVMGRDVRGVEEIGKMSNILEEWSTTTNQLLVSLSARIEQARKSDEDKSRQKLIQEENLRSVLMQIANAPPGSNGGMSGGLANGGTATKSAYDRLGSDRLLGDMDIDDDASGIKKKKSSAGGPMRSKRSRA